MSFSSIQASRRSRAGAAIRSVGILADHPIGNERRAEASGRVAGEPKRERLRVTICSWCDPQRPENAGRRRGVRVNYGICPDCLEEALLRLAERPLAGRDAESEASARARFGSTASAR